MSRSRWSRSALGPRAKTLSRRGQLRRLRQEAEAEAELGDVAQVERPKTRGDCAKGPRPCPFVACRHNLFLDVNEQSGSIKVNFPRLDIDELEETCALDVADSGGRTLEEIGTLMNLTRERVRQIEVKALRALERKGITRR